VVATQLQVKSGKISYSGYAYAIPSFLEGSVCAQTGKIGGKAGGETGISNDLLFAAGPGTSAAKFAGYKYYGYPYPGSYIEGDLATAGGTLTGLGFTEVSGITDTTGAYPGISSCEGALVDAVSASATLAGLTPTQTLTDVSVSGGDTFTITGGAGVNVVNVNSIKVKPGRDSYGYSLPSTLELELPGPTDTMIVNIATSLQLGNASAIVIVGGTPERVILNVHGGIASKVKIGGFEATIDPPILAPGAKLLAKGYSILSNLIGGSKSKIQGPEIADALLCQ
jgi:choice-of-anchor A domain-containing protein